MRFHDLTVSRVTPEAAGAVAITLAVPPELRAQFDFQPGQFLTVRADVNGADVRRSYSISSPRSRLAQVNSNSVSARSRAACSPTGPPARSKPATP